MPIDRPALPARDDPAGHCAGGKQALQPPDHLTLPAHPPRRHLLRAGGAGMLLAATGMAGGLAGCQWLPRRAQVPMAQRLLSPPGTTAAERRSQVLVVMLPGAYSPIDEFIDEGLVADTQAAGGGTHVLLADAHLGYFRNLSAIERLQADVIGPARAMGWRQVWLMGISLGGFGALGHAASHPGQVDGVVALAPYLGRPERLAAIEAAGGPRAWADAPPAATAPGQPADVAAADVAEQALWRWLARPPAGAPPVYLGFGTEDRLARGHRLLAQALPAERVDRVPGGHDWPPWRALWQRWLARGLLRPA